MSRKYIVLNEQTEAEQIGRFCRDFCHHRTVVITGASVGGIGFETARVLAKNGAEIILCCHTQDSCRKAVETIVAAHPRANIRGVVMDLMQFSSIQQCAEFILNLNRPIHVLINNAGILDGGTPTLTTDGFEKIWQVNHLGPVYLTKLLMPALIAGGTSDAPSRVVMVSSIMNHIYNKDTGIDYDQLAIDRDKLPTDPFRRYAESKLANILFAKQLTRQMEILPTLQDRDRVIGVSLHPGVCLSSQLYRSTSYTSILAWLVRVHFHGKCNFLRKERPKSIAQAAATIVFCAMHADIEAGQYYADCQISKVTHELIQDENEWKRCWDFVEEQIDERLKEIIMQHSNLFCKDDDK